MTSSPLRHVWIVWLVLAVCVGLRLPTIDSGQLSDDFLQRGMLLGPYPVERHPLDLYRFASGEPEETRRLTAAGGLPWWTSPNLKLAALRPLTSATILFDVYVLPGSAWQHVHSLVWWIALLWAAYHLFRRLVPPRVAVLALALYGLDESHVLPLAWLANRTVIISGFFAVLALIAHLRFREDGWRPGRVWAAVGLAACLLAGEYGLAAVAAFVAYEVVSGPGTWQVRARALAAPMVVALTYAVTHRILGYGTTGSGVYFDPMITPWAFLKAASGRVPMLIADATLGLSRDPGVLGDAWDPLRAGLGVAVLVTLLLVLVRQRADASTRPRWAWLMLALPLGIVPMASAFPLSRLLVIPGLSAAVLVALVLDAAWRRVKARDRGLEVRVFAGMGALVLVLMHMLWAPYVAWTDQTAIRKVTENGKAWALEAQIDDNRVAEQTLVVIASAEAGSIVYVPWIRWFHGSPLPKAWRILSVSHQLHRLTRVRKNALELEVVNGELMVGPDRLFRPVDAPLALGEVVEVDGMQVTILAVGPHGPTRMRFRFPNDLDDGSVVLLRSTNDALVQQNMPPVGKRIVIPPAFPH